MEASLQYQVVTNEEEQFSIWPRNNKLPAGWKSDGFDGSKEACLIYISEVWTDIRPKTVKDFIS